MLKRRDIGFTLTELIVIVAIAGTLAVICYPRLAQLVIAYRVENAARNLMADLQKVRFRAIAENRCFQVVFDTANKTYQVQKKVASIDCSSGTFADDGGSRKIDDADRISIAFTLGGDPIFNARGFATTNPSRIQLTFPSTSAARTVEVQQNGHISVF